MAGPIWCCAGPGAASAYALLAPLRERIRRDVYGDLRKLGVGAGLEESSFGRGQAVMITGILVCLVSMVAWDVLEASGAWEAVR